MQAWSPEGPVDVTAHKCERFIFDLLTQAQKSLGLEIVREDEFAPVKNAEGVDSAVSARQLASDCYRRWLTTAGVAVTSADDQLIEISPRFAGTADFADVLRTSEPQSNLQSNLLTSGTSESRQLRGSITLKWIKDVMVAAYRCCVVCCVARDSYVFLRFWQQLMMKKVEPFPDMGPALLAEFLQQEYYDPALGEAISARSDGASRFARFG